MLFDLNDLVTNSPGWSLTAAYGINARGQIVGTGIYMGQSAAFRLDPTFALTSAVSDEASPELAVSAVPEPGSLVLLETGVLLLTFRKQLRLTNRY